MIPVPLDTPDGAPPTPAIQPKLLRQATFGVSNDGNQVNAHTPTSRAAADGIRRDVAILLTVVAAAATLVAVAHWRMGRMRDRQRERELRCLIDDDGGRNDRSYG